MRRLERHPTNVFFRPDATRVLVRAFIPGDPTRVANILGRGMSLSESDCHRELAGIEAEFAERHLDIHAVWRRHFELLKPHLAADAKLSETRQLYLGALVSGEYALESAALFNPSIVPHPDQSALNMGDLRFILSLRATGEGHISSIEFRSGVIRADHTIEVDSTSRFVTAPTVNPNPTFLKSIFVHKLQEMGFANPWSSRVMDSLGNRFTHAQLEDAMKRAASQMSSVPRELQRTIECVRWLAQSNYEVSFPATIAVSERIIFPVSSNESNGMEDARFVRLLEDDGTVVYYGTYTAYNGRAILPQLIETTDFLNFRVLTLNGSAVQNKGMAIFPRKIGGRYAMISRQDDENLYLIYSDNPHFWSDPHLLRTPLESWEYVKIGNCGSPIETPAGWLVITHGVGPMRKYCIGAMLLDLHDPSKVIGHLRQPLIRPEGNAREGYVPNVVYTCGALVHAGRLVLPYAMSDTISTIVTVEVDALLGLLRD
jgi:predicted GH43/DUF377 family glycosyl hydrolase